MSTPSWLERLQESYEQDAEPRQLLLELSLSTNNTNDKGFVLQDGIIRFKGRV
jgi:hypothetical protein